MNIDNINLVPSQLIIKASGSIEHEIIEDLLKENGQSIASLLDDQEKKSEN
jgi:hypothetical protein